jgi:hypothetical protein
MSSGTPNVPFALSGHPAHPGLQFTAHWIGNHSEYDRLVGAQPNFDPLGVLSLTR